MNIYDGTYSWDGKRHGSREPITRFPGCYNLKIFDLQAPDDGVTRLKPFLCVFSETGNGHSILANPARFATYICEEFSLEFERVLWVENLASGTQDYEVVVFSKKAKLGNEWLYSMERRQPTPAELKLIETAMESAENV